MIKKQIKETVLGYKLLWLQKIVDSHLTQYIT